MLLSIFLILVSMALCGVAAWIIWSNARMSAQHWRIANLERGVGALSTQLATVAGAVVAAKKTEIVEAAPQPEVRAVSTDPIPEDVLKLVLDHQAEYEKEVIRKSPASVYRLDQRRLAVEQRLMTILPFREIVVPVNLREQVEKAVR